MKVKQPVHLFLKKEFFTFLPIVKKILLFLLFCEMSLTASPGIDPCPLSWVSWHPKFKSDITCSSFLWSFIYLFNWKVIFYFYFERCHWRHRLALTPAHPLDRLLTPKTQKWYNLLIFSLKKKIFHLPPIEMFTFFCKMSPPAWPGSDPCPLSWVSLPALDIQNLKLI